MLHPRFVIRSGYYPSALFGTLRKWRHGLATWVPHHRFQAILLAAVLVTAAVVGSLRAGASPPVVQATLANQPASAGPANRDPPQALLAAPSAARALPGPVVLPRDVTPQPEGRVRRRAPANKGSIRRIASLSPQGVFSRSARSLAPSTDVAAPQQESLTPSRSAAEPLYRKGLWYQRHGEVEQAIAMYEEALRLAPQHRAASAALLSAALEANASEKACVLGARLHEKFPDDKRVALNWAVALVACARPREAIKLLDEQASLPDPYLFEIYFHKGVAYRQLGEQQQALYWYRKAEGARPNDSRLLFNLALAFEREGDYAQALRYYRQYLAVLPAHETRMRERVGQRVAVIENDLLPDQAHRAAP